MNGSSFEKIVTDMYIRLGKKNVKHDVLLKKKGIRGQFDITYGRFFTKYVECKYRSSHSVTFSDVATFKAKLDLFSISPKRGIFITNNDYERRAKVYANQMGVTLINGYKFKKMYRRSLPLLQRFQSLDSLINF